MSSTADFLVIGALLVRNSDSVTLVGQQLDAQIVRMACAVLFSAGLHPVFSAPFLAISHFLAQFLFSFGDDEIW